jgi:hypothetical protein
MVALRTLADEIYNGDYAPDYDWPPAPLHSPLLSVVPKRKKRTYAEKQARTDGIRVAIGDRVVSATDETLVDVIRELIPHSALEPAPTMVLPEPDSKPLPLDEKPRYPYPKTWDLTPEQFATFLADFNRGDVGSIDDSTVREKTDNDGNRYKE